VVVEAGEGGGLVHHLAHAPLGAEEHGLAGLGGASRKTHLEVRSLHLATQHDHRLTTGLTTAGGGGGGGGGDLGETVVSCSVELQFHQRHLRCSSAALRSTATFRSHRWLGLWRQHTHTHTHTHTHHVQHQRYQTPCTPPEIPDTMYNTT